MSTQITTGKVRFSYCNLFTPRAAQEGAKEKYSVTLLIPKSDKATIQKIRTAME
ncbi:MAG: ssDNA-binding protein, partial [Christensenellaceae bacterium]